MREWTLSVPRRPRYYMQRDATTLDMELRLLLRAVAQSRQTQSPGAAQMDMAALRICAVAFIHRFGQYERSYTYQG